MTWGWVGVEVGHGYVRIMSSITVVQCLYGDRKLSPILRYSADINRAVTRKKDLMVLRFVDHQMHMHSPLIWLRTCVFTWSVLRVSTTWLRTAKAQARLRLCTGSPEPLLNAYLCDKNPFRMCWLNFFLVLWDSQSRSCIRCLSWTESIIPHLFLLLLFCYSIYFFFICSVLHKMTISSHVIMILLHNSSEVIAVIVYYFWPTKEFLLWVNQLYRFTKLQHVANSIFQPLTRFRNAVSTVLLLYRACHPRKR